MRFKQETADGMFRVSLALFAVAAAFAVFAVLMERNLYQAIGAAFGLWFLVAPLIMFWLHLSNIADELRSIREELQRSKRDSEPILTAEIVPPAEPPATTPADVETMRQAAERNRAGGNLR